MTTFRNFIKHSKFFLNQNLKKKINFLKKINKINNQLIAKIDFTHITVRMQFYILL